MKRVVVTGLGAITPLGNSVNEYWNSLIQGKSGAGSITKFDASQFKTQFACEVKDFDPLQTMEKAEARKLDLFSQYAFASVAECFRDAALDLEKVNRRRAGVIWASGIGGIETFEQEVISFGQGNGIPRFSPFFITKMIPNIAAGQLSIKHGLQGPSYATVSACTSSNNALADAVNLIRVGKADVMLAGGSEAAIIKSSIGGFNAARALSTRNESPETASRPFDSSRDGFVMGEGAGALLLEDYEHAKARGARIYCELSAFGFASDAYHITSSHPEGLGAVYAMQDALNEAKLRPDQVDYVNTHATATPVGDISECKAIAKVFAASLDKLHISATKSMTGHLLGAAGAIEAIACVKAIEQNTIPPTINFENLDPEIDPRIQITPNKVVQKEVKVALNNSFGFGGHIAVSLFKKWEE
ncbi:MAG: beta-ketoacyl-ACP synthase II [Candidatus Cyclobacteriaceae bacterium M3_2C_046]